MEEYYDIYEYRYKNKNGGLKAVIYAREDETAERIVSLMNMETCFHWVPRKFRFKIKKQINVPPYELEQEQLEVAQENLERRRENNERKRESSKVNGSSEVQE